MNTYRMPFSVAITLLASSLSVHAFAGGIEAGSPATRAKISAPAVRVFGSNQRARAQGAARCSRNRSCRTSRGESVAERPSQQRATSSPATALADPGANSPAAGNAHGSNIGTAKPREFPLEPGGRHGRAAQDSLRPGRCR